MKWHQCTLNESFYTNAHSVTNIPLVSGSFEESKLDCAINGRYSSSWIIHAASTVVVFKIPMYPSTGPLATGYADLIGLETTVLAACIIQLDE
jgi:hypothetical protein